MTPDIDLSSGVASAAKPGTGKSRADRLSATLRPKDPPRGSVKGPGNPGRPKTGTGTPTTKTEIKAQLSDVFDKLIDVFHNRNDEEIAGCLEEDKAAMIGGIISLTNSVPFLRLPIVFGLGILQPILAFGRLGGILLRRWRNRPVVRQEQQEPAPV